jgi:uncharacterized protein (TIGR03118 family)
MVWKTRILRSAKSTSTKQKKVKKVEMKTNLSQKNWKRSVAGAAALAILACVGLSAKADGDDIGRFYQQINLVSDLPGVAQLQDTNLVNAWGISYHPGFPFWISDNGTGKTTLYSVTNDASGAPHVARIPLVVSIPGDGNVSGQVMNNTSGFNTNAFLFVSEDGTISGWRPALGNAAEVLATGTNAVYKGVTLATNVNAVVLLAANFGEATVDVYDSSARLIGQFADTRVPAGYAPFNVQSIGDAVFVTFAKQNAAKHDDVAAPGRGLIDLFDVRTGTFHRFAAGTRAGGKVREMNSPWGIALAPRTFGEHANHLLVGNFGSGTIMSFDAHGHFHGLLKGSGGCPVTIDGLWALIFGAGGASGVATDLYFTAGPNGEGHGMFGVLQPADDRDNDRDRD